LLLWSGSDAADVAFASGGDNVCRVRNSSFSALRACVDAKYGCVGRGAAYISSGRGVSLVRLWVDVLFFVPLRR